MSTPSPSSTTSIEQRLGPRTWIPLIVIFTLTFIYINIYAAVSGQYTLRRTCLDLNLPHDCKTDEALELVAKFSIIALLIPGIVCILSIGAIGAISTRIGRKYTLFLSILGQLIVGLGWGLVFWFPELFQKHWKLLVISTLSISKITGGILILYLALFGSVADISAKKPSMRTVLFVGFDLIVGFSGVVGAQSAALLMRVDEIWLISIYAIGMTLNLFLTIFILPETLEDSVRLAPIDYAKANTLGQLAFLFPFQSTKKILEEDAKKIYDKISILYKEQLIREGKVDELNNNEYTSPIINGINNSDPNNSLQPYELQRHTTTTTNELLLDLPQYTEDESMAYAISSDAAVSGVNALPINYAELQYINGIKNTLMHDSPAVSAAYTPQSPILRSSSSESMFMLDDSTEPITTSPSDSTQQIYTLQKNNDNNDGQRELLLDDGKNSKKEKKSKKHHKKDKKDKKPKVDERGIPYLTLSTQPRLIPHRNSFLMLVLCIFWNVLVLLGFKACDLYYLKKTFGITPQDYSNLITIAAVVRGVGSFVLFPFFKKFITTPTAEKWLLVAMCLTQSIAFTLLPLTKSFFQFSCVCILYYLCGTFPSGIVRSLTSNQVSQQLQKYILSAIAAAEVWVFVFGGVGFNTVWLKTQKTHPTYILYALALCSAISAIFPILINDSSDDFNLRIEMTTNYTKIRTAEKKFEEQLEQEAKIALQGDIGFTGNGNGGNDNNGDYLHDDAINTEAV